MEQVVRGRMGQVLGWAGALLLVAGSLVAYPYIASRLAAAPVAWTPTASPSVPCPTAISPTPTDLPTMTSGPLSTCTRTPVPTGTPTPLPALPDRIAIPAIDLDAPVEPVAWKTVEVDGQAQAMWDLPESRAAGWHDTSAPLGVAGNTVLNGHNTTHGEIFRDLYTLDAGSTIILYAGTTAYTYTVAERLILPEAEQPLEVRVENARFILPTEDERVTLVTCHPYGSLRNRLIVVAYPAGDPADHAGFGANAR